LRPAAAQLPGVRRHGFRMRGFTMIAVLLVLFACGTPEPVDRVESEAPEARPSEVSEAEAVPIDWSAVREQHRSARLERGEVATVKFEGEFAGGGLPTAPAQVIPLDSFDIRFIIEVRVIRVIEGQLPEGWESGLTFGVHSPAILFRLQGVETPEGHHVPEGRFLLTLWQAPDGQYDLEIEQSE
jgi:hypothetical protein